MALASLADDACGPARREPRYLANTALHFLIKGLPFPAK